MQSTLISILFILGLAILILLNELYEYHQSRIIRHIRPNPLLDRCLDEKRASAIYSRLKKNGYDPKSFREWMRYVSSPGHTVADNFNRHLDKRKDNLSHRPAKPRHSAFRQDKDVFSAMWYTFMSLIRAINRPIRFSEPFKHLEQNQ
jgi:hypothetical protein